MGLEWGGVRGKGAEGESPGFEGRNIELEDSKDSIQCYRKAVDPESQLALRCQTCACALCCRSIHLKVGGWRAYA